MPHQQVNLPYRSFAGGAAAAQLGAAAGLPAGLTLQQAQAYGLGAATTALTWKQHCSVTS